MSITVSTLAQFSINGNKIDPENPRFQAIDAARTDYIIIQPRHPLSTTESDELKRLGVEVQGVVAQNTLLCKYKPTDIEVVRQCPFLQYVDVYRNICVISPNFRQSVSSTSTQITEGDASQLFLLETQQNPSSESSNVNIDVILHKDLATNNEVVLAKIASTAGIPQSSLKISPYFIHINVSSDRLENLAKLDEVSKIEEVMPMGPNDDYAERIMHTDLVLNATDFTGQGQTVTVADTGFDNGTIDNCHPAFKGKITKLISVWRKDQNNERGHGTNDPFNHGTHVCGSIVAEGVSSITHERIRGIAPGAKLVVQSLSSMDDEVHLIKRPQDIIGLLDTARKDFNSGVHTNSWGPYWNVNTGQQGYTKECSVLDNYIRQHPDLTVCWSAGNDGNQSSSTGKLQPSHGNGQIGNYAASKNVITVGSTVSDRPLSPQLSYSSATESAVEQGVDINAVAYNSSCGPTLWDGRIKPDVVAPGVRILSATSQDPDWQNQLSVNTSRDKLWETMSGTSMATPQVAGCIAIIKEAFEKHGIAKRFAEADVIKALLVNGAVSLKDIPTARQGFGRVDLGNSMIIPELTPHAGIFTHEGLTTGETATFATDVPTYAELAKATSIDILNPMQNVTLSATLVYLDHEAPVLANHLRFAITASNGMECHGNKSPGVIDFDTVNNVQKIVWHGISQGTARVTILAHDIQIPGDKQSCAVVWRFSN